MSEPMAEYVRHHRCYNADPNVSIADWDRGILAIEAEAVSRDEAEVLADVQELVRAELAKQRTEALPSAERLAVEVDRHWMESSIAQGFVRCSCGQWRVDIPGHFDVPSLGQHFRPFSAHVAAAILAMLADSLFSPPTADSTADPPESRAAIHARKAG